MDILHTILGKDPSAGLLVIFNLIIIESLLSVDNAAVLATMVMDLPKEQRNKALKYGIIGAYVFRGLSLLLAATLVKIWWLKPAGGAYLVYLAFDYFKSKLTPQEEDDTLDKKTNFFYRNTLGLLGPFWSTVVLVEIMDLAFSIDNVFAAVAFTDNIWLICIGVFIGILAMRFVAQAFVKLMERYPFLETAAFLVILLLGLKLLLSLWTHFNPLSDFSIFLEGHTADIFVSVITVSVFFIPMITSFLFNWPKKVEKKEEEEGKA
jgi:YkoY family integral membrane protein